MVNYRKTYKSKKKKYDMVIVYMFITVFVSFSCSLYLLLDIKAPKYYSLLPILPIMFAICFFIAFNTYQYLFKKLSVTIIIATYFFRMVILPVIIALGDYSIFFGSYTVVITYDLVSNNMNNAILLLCYEALVVFIVLATSKFTNGDHNSNNKKIHFNKQFGKKTLLFKIILILMLVFIGCALIIYPVLSNYFSFFVATSTESDIANSKALLTMKESVPSVIYWSYIFVCRFLQVFLPILTLQFIYSQYGAYKQKRAILLSLIVIILVFSFMTPEKVTSILLAIILFVVSCKLYPGMRKIAPPIMLLLITFTFIGLLFKSGIYRQDYNFWKNISTTFNAYFSGPLNVSAALSMNYNVSLKVIIADILDAVPFMSHFLKDWAATTPEYYNYSIKGNGAQVTKIIPMVGQGYFYFGFILAPIFSFFSIKIAIMFEEKVYRNSNIFKKYIYLFATASFAISPVLYNLNIALSNLCYILLNLLLMNLAYNRVENKYYIEK